MRGILISITLREKTGCTHSYNFFTAVFSPKAINTNPTITFNALRTAGSKKLFIKLPKIEIMVRKNRVDNIAPSPKKYISF